MRGIVSTLKAVEQGPLRGRKQGLRGRVRGAAHRIEGKGMDANAANLSQPLGGMAPEEIGDARPLEKLQAFQRPDVLTDRGSDATK